jgi:hypothetical protein
MMTKPPTADLIADGLTVPERMLLFCLASETDWQRAGVKQATAQQMMIRGLIERQAAGSFVLSDHGRAVLEALLMRAATRGHFAVVGRGLLPWDSSSTLL